MQMQTTLNSKTLTSLALLETNLISQDYLSTFIPFIATLILKKRYEKVNLGEVVKDFKEEFGISIPRAPMQSILSKATTKGLISPTQGGEYIPVKDELINFSFLSEQNPSQTKIEAILNSFIEFALSKYDKIITQEEAGDIFISFLDKYSPRAISGKYDIEEDDKETSNKDLYLMGSFIQELILTNESIFDNIRRIAMSYLIATALTFDEPVETRLTEFANLTIYLDTPVVLRLLGLHTTELEESYKEMFVNFDKTISPKFIIFQHTFDEVAGIIQDCANWIDNPSYNPVYANQALVSFIRRKFSKTQIDLYVATLEAKLKEFNIVVDEVEYYNLIHNSRQIEVQKLKIKLIEAYKKNKPDFDVKKNEYSINYDLRSIENIVKLWGTKSSKSYSRLGYLFITTNSTLAHVCRKYTAEYWWDSRNHKSPCVTDYYLGTMVWLSTPADKIESVSKLKLIADCSAATTLSREVMERFSIELENLKEFKGIDDSNYLLLRQCGFNNNYLQNITLNEETAFKDDILEQLLEDIKADIQKPLVNKINEKDLTIRSLETEKNIHTDLIHKMEKENEQLRIKIIREEERHEKLANETAGRIINTYAPITIAFFVFSAALLLILPKFSNVSVYIKVFSALCSFISAIFFGVMKSNLFGAYNKLTVRIKKHYQIKSYKEALNEENSINL